MWLFVFFDLPTLTKQDRKRAALFRKVLLKDGFSMQQFSVYKRHCASLENTEVHAKRVESALPPEGEVMFIVITDKQYGRARVFYGKKRQATPKTPAQLEFF